MPAKRRLTPPVSACVTAHRLRQRHKAIPAHRCDTPIPSQAMSWSVLQQPSWRVPSLWPVRCGMVVGHRVAPPRLSRQRAGRLWQWCGRRRRLIVDPDLIETQVECPELGERCRLGCVWARHRSDESDCQNHQPRQHDCHPDDTECECHEGGGLARIGAAAIRPRRAGSNAKPPHGGGAALGRDPALPRRGFPPMTQRGPYLGAKASPSEADSRHPQEPACGRATRRRASGGGHHSPAGALYAVWRRWAGKGVAVV